MVCLCVEQVQLFIIDWCCLFKSTLGQSFWDLAFADTGVEWGPAWELLLRCHRMQNS